jgi:hypothetical protein
MKCSTCGADSEVVGVANNPQDHRVTYMRVCDLGHRFQTVEVYPTQLADARDMACAIRNVNRRIAHFKRNIAIARDTRSTKDVAADYGLTDARVRQIRASLPDRASHERFAKIAENLERIQS